MLKKTKIIAITIISIYLFNGCEDNNKIPLPTYLKSKSPKFVILEDIPIQYIKVSKIDRTYCKVRCTDIKNASKLSMLRNKKNNFYEKYISEYNQEFAGDNK